MTISAQIISKKNCMLILTAWANYITDSNKTFRSRSRGILINLDSDSASWFLATSPRDSDSILLLKRLALNSQKYKSFAMNLKAKTT